MEPDLIKRQLTIDFIRELQQIPYSSQSEVVQEYLKAMATISSVADDSASTDWYGEVAKGPQQHTWEELLVNYWEELVDKDLGIVRKINLK